MRKFVVIDNWEDYEHKNIFANVNADDLHFYEDGFELMFDDEIDFRLKAFYSRDENIEYDPQYTQVYKQEICDSLDYDIIDFDYIDSVAADVIEKENLRAKELLEALEEDGKIF